MRLTDTTLVCKSVDYFAVLSRSSPAYINYHSATISNPKTTAYPHVTNKFKDILRVVTCIMKELHSTF